MTHLPDTLIPLSRLEPISETAAHLPTQDYDSVQIGGALQAVVRRACEQQLTPDERLHAVSVTFDISSDASSDAPVELTSRIDRKTRTLIFASGLATQAGQALLKATLVYRIASSQAS